MVSIELFKLAFGRVDVEVKRKYGLKEREGNARVRIDRPESHGLDL
jgi:hypothetical protein